MKKNSLLAALVLIATGGFLLHYRIHPFRVPDPLYPGAIAFRGTFFLASLFPFIDIFGVTALFLSRRTAVYGYLLNGLLVIYGTIFMAHFSLAQMVAKQIPLSAMLLNSTLPDITILWADFFIGKALYEAIIRGGDR